MISKLGAHGVRSTPLDGVKFADFKVMLNRGGPRRCATPPKSVCLGDVLTGSVDSRKHCKDHSNRGFTMLPSPTPVHDPADWVASESSPDAFTVHLKQNHLDALDAALRHAQSLACDLYAIAQQDFPLDAIAADVDSWVEDVMRGRGIIILDGFPVDRYSKGEMGITIGPLDANKNIFSTSNFEKGSRVEHI